jgi:hypothetical protein
VLADLGPRPEKALVVHLCAHARTREGKVFLLPANADPDEPGTWLPLAEVVRLLGQCPAAHKLLILDVMRPAADARLGVLVDEVAERVQASLEPPDAPGLLILCACSAGQTSLVSEELRQSVFGYYLAQGLGGRADGHGPDGRRDGRVTAHELAAFVGRRVDRWAARNRGTRQTPVLFGRGEDFPLVVLPEGKSGPAPEPAPVEESYPPWLTKGWEVRDGWWADGSFRVAPRAFRQLEAALLRAEQHWRGGRDAGRVESELADDLKGCKGRLEQARALAQPGPQPRPRSLAQGRDPAGKPDAAAGAALRYLLAQLDQGLLAKPDDVKKARQEFRKKFADKPPFPELAWTALATLADDPLPSRPKVQFVHELLHSFGQPPFAETLLLQRLAEKAPRRWPPDAVQRLLRVVREEGKALARSPRALAWFGPQFRDAAANRRKGELLLFTGRPSSWGEVNTLLGEGERLYQEINRHLDAVEDAQRLDDEALALLPGYEPSLAGRREPEGRAENDWAEAVRAVVKLDGLLARPAGKSPPSLDELNTPVTALRGHLDDLGRPFRAGQMKQMIGRTRQGGPRDYLEAEALLGGPRLGAADRAALWRAGRELADRLHQGTLAAEQAEDPGQPEPEDRPARPAGREQEARRARLSLGLLKLAGLAGVGEMERELEQLGAQPPDSAWESLGAKLRAAWADRLPDQLRGEQDLARADRLSRLLPPEEDVARDPATDRDPTAERRRGEARAFAKWLGEYYQAESESTLFDGREVDRGFYAAAAREYLLLSR